MLQRVSILLVSLVAVSMAAPVLAQQASTPTNKDVSFETEDGWTIHGTYYLPQDAGQLPVPGLVVLNEPDIIPGYIAGRTARQMAVLLINMRGTGASFGNKDYQLFSQEERDAIQLDIRAAIKFLSSQKEVDSKRIAILGSNDAADDIAREAALNLAQVKALVLSTGRLTDKGRAGIKFRKDLPVLAIASEDDPRETQQQSAEPFFLAQDRGSRLMFVVDRGASIFNRPGQVVERVTDWLKSNLGSLGTQTEVSFNTKDGQTLRGTLYKPDGAAQPDKVAGVVFVHGANHDATTWYHLAREVTKTGLAALIFDQRGYMKSIAGMKPLDQTLLSTSMPLAGTILDPDNMLMDIKTAIDFLASQSWVDPDRLALVTATSRAAPTVMVAHGDARIRTIVGLSFYGGTDETRKALAGMDIPMLMIASTNDMNADGGSLEAGTREAYRLSNSKESELLMYDDAGRGSSMLKTKPELTGIIVRWLNEKLAR